MLKKKAIKIATSLITAIFAFGLFSPIKSTVQAAPATKDISIEGDSFWTINLSSVHVPAGANTGSVDFNGNGKFDENEKLSVSGIDNLVLGPSASESEEVFFTISEVETKVLPFSVTVEREDIKGYSKSYLRNSEQANQLYLKVSLGGKVKESLKKLIDDAVAENKKNIQLIDQSRGKELSFKAQEELATVFLNLLGALDKDGKPINAGTTLDIAYSRGSDKKMMKVNIEDIVLDSTVGEANEYANIYNVPKIIDNYGNIYLKVYGLPTNAQIETIMFSNGLKLPHSVDKSVVNAYSNQKVVGYSKPYALPKIDPLLTESINSSNLNVLDIATISPTTGYFIDLSIIEDVIVGEGDRVIQYILNAQDSKTSGYEHSNVRPTEDGVILYDVLYDPENTVKKIEVQDIYGNTYNAQIIPEEKKVGTTQSMATIKDFYIASPDRNSPNYKDIKIVDLKPDTKYEFKTMSIIFNNGDGSGDIRRIFTNFDIFSTSNPIGILTMSGEESSDAVGGIKIDELSLVEITPSKIVYYVEISDPNKVVEDVFIVGDDISTSVYDEEEGTVTLYGLTQNTLYDELYFGISVKGMKDDLYSELPEVSTKKISSTAHWIEGFYNIFFGRDGDPEGMKFWTNELMSHKSSANYFITNIVNEKEYMEKNYDNSIYVSRMYRSVVGRDPDEEGFKWWLSTLNSTISEYGDRIKGMQQISLRMLGETETKNFIRNLGMKVED